MSVTTCAQMQMCAGRRKNEQRKGKETALASTKAYILHIKALMQRCRCTGRGKGEAGKLGAELSRDGFPA